MTFTTEQVADLQAPLDRSHVKEREQAGRKFSYIEGWHAIAEANRIFGFDAWDRETVELSKICETQVDGKYRVAYLAKVRIRLDGIVREGCGYGSGIDRDLGSAHESALKEAETDAMKRALMTFGNPFGLALYDKTQANVADTPPAEPSAAVSAAKVAIELCKTKEDLEKWSADNASALDLMSEEERNAVRAAWAARSRQLKRAA